MYVEYLTGHQKTELKPVFELIADPQAPKKEGTDEVTLVTSHFNSTNIKDDNINLIKLNQTLLMNIESGNSLIFKLKTDEPFADNQVFNLSLNFEFYLT